MGETGVSCNCKACQAVRPLLVKAYEAGRRAPLPPSDPDRRKSERVLLANLVTRDVNENTVTLTVSTALWENWQSDWMAHVSRKAEGPTVAAAIAERDRALEQEDLSSTAAAGLAIKNVELRDQRDRLREALESVIKWATGETQVDDGEDAEDALRYIEREARASLAALAEGGMRE